MIIRLCDIQCHAYHGVLEEEKEKGNTFRVNITVDIDAPIGIDSDDIQDTMDYRRLCDIVEAEMRIPSDLIEHVAWRIKRSILAAFPLANEVRVRVAKMAPPMSLAMEWVEVEL